MSTSINSKLSFVRIQEKTIFEIPVSNMSEVNVQISISLSPVIGWERNAKFCVINVTFGKTGPRASDKAFT